MKPIILPAPEAAVRAAALYETLLSRKPDAVLGLATGSTPLGLYAQLAALHRAGRLSFARATSFNLDEYVGLPPTHDQSYRYFMEQNLFSKVDLPAARIHVPSGLDVSDAALAGYDAAIEAAGGIDLQLLGLGGNGHIGFNEPGTPFELGTHVVTLTERTRRDNARFFASLDEVPTHAATMGVRPSCTRGRSCCSRSAAPRRRPCARRSRARSRRRCRPPVLQLHPDVTVICDEEAAKLL